ncbi:MAG: orotidine 5'-phosphate decarboxylase, partial [Candidatus Omnitrophica bacterium]|nr:orotidine 5'-phosphate decarboxylase [Candidatus Omnitrophota bacterium]
MKTKLIVALDVDSSKRAKEIVKILYPKVKIFKVGLQLFTAQGPLVVNWLVKKGIKVVLDLKL